MNETIVCDLLYMLKNTSIAAGATGVYSDMLSENSKLYEAMSNVNEALEHASECMRTAIRMMNDEEILKATKK